MTFFSDAFTDHLSFDAVVAFADGELSLAAYQRAAAHIARCATCAAEVAEQNSAREMLRSAFAPKMPGSLFDQLRSIPVALPMLSSGAGDVVRDGSMHEAGLADQARRSWFGRH